MINPSLFSAKNDMIFITITVRTIELDRCFMSKRSRETFNYIFIRKIDLIFVRQVLFYQWVEFFSGLRTCSKKSKQIGRIRGKSAGLGGVRCGWH